MQVWRALVMAIGSMALGAISAQGQGTDTFTINIPKKNVAPFVPIGEVKAVIGLSTMPTAGTPVTFTIKDQLGTQQQTTCSPACSPSSLSFNDNENGSRGPDTIAITLNSSSSADPVRYEMDFLLSSNIAPNNSCNNTQQTNPNTYEVKVSPTPGFTMVGVCLESFDGRIRSTMPPVNVCTPAQWTYNEIPIPHDAGDDVATINPLPQPTFACYSARPPLDVVMILDKSGSMQITDLGVSNSRIAQLHDSVGTFLDTWSALSPPSDNVGVVTFDTTASVRTPLEDVATNSAAIKTDVANNVGPGGSTSVG